MTTITFKGEQVRTAGQLPPVGSRAPYFQLVANDLSEKSLKDFAGRQVVLNIFPSLDTAVCATTVRRFNAEAAARPEVVVLCISADLPFAQARFCGAEGLDDVITLSTFRHREFGQDYGVVMTTGPLRGLMSRAVLVLGPDAVVKYAQQVPEIAEEPDYEAALAALE